jgi:hypothetical protein
VNEKSVRDIEVVLVNNGRMPRPSQLLLLVALSLPIATYGLLVGHYSVNIPVWDDYDTILKFLNLPDATRLQTLVAQHNEHRLVWTRVAAEVCNRLLHQSDFRLLICIGNAGLVLLFVVLCRVFSRRNLPAPLLVPISFLLFQPQPWENMTWATGSLQNNYSLLFALLTLYFWDKRRLWSYVLAAFLAVIGSYTSANGLVVFALLLAWEVANHLPRLRVRECCVAGERIRLFGLAVLTAAVAFLYFRGYTKPPHHPDIADSLSHVVRLGCYALTLLGSHMQRLGEGVVLSVGGLETAFFAYLAYRRYDRHSPVIFYFLAFLMASVAVMAIGRSGFGVDQAFAPKYRIIAIAIFVVELIAAIETWPAVFAKKLVIVCVTLVAIGFDVDSTRSALPRLEARRDMLRAGIVRWTRTGRGLDYPDQAKAAEILRESIEKGTYRPPKNPGS